MVIRNLPDFPEGIADGSSVIYDSKMYVSCPANSKGLTNSMWSINLESEDKRWVQCQSLPGKPRSFPGLVKIGERIVLLGGIVLPKFEVLKDAYAYSPKEDKWERLANLPCPCYGFGARAIDNKKILIAGIGDEKIRNSIWILDVSDMSVRNIGDTVIPTVGACLVQQAENAFWLIGGEPDANKSRTNKITVIKL
jgi:N-acetylneuraminic acid mutarotase